jgi:hypothetical protein
MILAGIDGTGVWDDADFARDFQFSFVNYICHHTPVSHAHYWRGPSTLGLECTSLVVSAYEWILSQRSADQEGVLLIGYSRGAACVVEVAQLLQEQGVSVRGMMLFDCVDRDILNDAARIPDNVREVWHVTRDRMSASRESFGNDGLEHGAGTIYHPYSFLGTHGAMGGTPWLPPGFTRGEAPAGGWDDYGPSDFLIDEGGVDGLTNITYRQDRECSTLIWNTLSPTLRRVGFIR